MKMLWLHLPPLEHTHHVQSLTNQWSHTGSYRSEPALIKHLNQNIYSLIGKITQENHLRKICGDFDRYIIYLHTICPKDRPVFFRISHFASKGFDGSYCVCLHGQQRNIPRRVSPRTALPLGPLPRFHSGSSVPVQAILLPRRSRCVRLLLRARFHQEEKREGAPPGALRQRRLRAAQGASPSRARRQAAQQGGDSASGDRIHQTPAEPAGPERLRDGGGFWRRAQWRRAQWRRA